MRGLQGFRLPAAETGERGMSNVHPHPSSGTAPLRERINIPVEEFASKLGVLIADAEDKGARGALLTLDAPADKLSDYRETMEVSNAARARLYGAMVKLMLRGIQL
mgnify:CR=1 FL=1